MNVSKMSLRLLAAAAIRHSLLCRSQSTQKKANSKIDELIGRSKKAHLNGPFCLSD